MVAHQAVVLQFRVRIRCLPSPQLTANLLVGCHLGMALGCGLTSVRGNRGKNYKNEHTKYLVITELTIATLFARVFVMRHQMSC
jgi:hypothetical protein